MRFDFRQRNDILKLYRVLLISSSLQLLI